MDANERENEELLVLGIKKNPPLHVARTCSPIPSLENSVPSFALVGRCGLAAPTLPVAGASCSRPSMERPAPCFEQSMNATILFFCLQVFCLPSVHLRNQWSNIRNERGERRAWRLESAATIEEVSRKMRDTAGGTPALPLKKRRIIRADLWDKVPCH